jgi:3,4-dihydroxy 2-butanone 4-phosphate synthase/GTP cyclohydrolase II
MFSTIEEVSKIIKDGEVVIIVDDEASERGGILMMASELTSKEKINYIMKLGAGFTYLSLTEEKVERLNLPNLFIQRSGVSYNEYITSVDYNGVQSGVSAEERTLTIHQLLEEKQEGREFRIPGHVFLTVSVKGGILKKAANAEAACDLAEIAGLIPSGTYAEILGEDGSLASMDQVKALAEREQIRIITMESIIAYRREKDCYVVREAEASLPTAYGDFNMVGFVNKINGEHHVALVKGEISTEDEVLVRVHSECLTGDAFHSLKCDCGEQLAAALANIEKEGKGVLLYLRQEGRGIGLINKIKAYKLQEEGMDTEEANLALGFPSDMRDYGIGAQILSELNVRKLRLMTNNPKKIIGLKGHGIEIVERVPLIMDTNIHNERYFTTKKSKMGHLY